MSTDLEIARRAVDQMIALQLLAYKDEFGDETLRIIAEAVAAGRREGEADGKAEGIGIGERHSSDAVVTILNSWFYAPMTRQEDAT